MEERAAEVPDDLVAEQADRGDGLALEWRERKAPLLS